MFQGLFQPMHLVIILVIVLIVFGPGKLPDIGKALGSGLRDFKKAVSEGEKHIEGVQKDLSASDSSKKNEQ